MNEWMVQWKGGWIDLRMNGNENMVRTYRVESSGERRNILQNHIIHINIYTYKLFR